MRTRNRSGGRRGDRAQRERETEEGRGDRAQREEETKKEQMTTVTATRFGRKE